MKSLYIVDYWVPFPSSEYGGVDMECNRKRSDNRMHLI
jgi:hypothetical protein